MQMLSLKIISLFNIKFNIKNNVKIWVSVLAFSCLTPINVEAVNILTDVQNERARILFDWQNQVNITPVMAGNQLSIQFNQDSEVDIESLLSGLQPYVLSANQPNGHQIILTLNQIYGLQVFQNGNVNGVDLLIKADKKNQQLIDNLYVKTNQSILTTDPTKLRKNSKKNASNPIMTNTEPLSNLVKMKIDNDAVEQNETSLFPKPVIKPEYSKNNNLLQKSETKENNKNNLQALAEQLKLPKMVVGINKNSISADFFFPFSERTAVAALQYGSELYLFFSNKAIIDLNNLVSTLPSFVTDIEQIYHDSATILKFKAQPKTNLYATARQTGKGYEWRINMMRRPNVPKNIIIPEIIAKPPIKPHIFLNAMQLSNSIDFQNDITGEYVKVIPSYESNSGVYPSRITADIKILQTGQGVAYIALSDDIKLLRLRQGIRLTKLGGLNISENIPELPQDNLISNINSNSFFPYEQWKAQDYSDFVKKERELLQEISVSNERKIPALRLALTQLYMAEGLHMEAIGMLDLIQSSASEFYDDYQLAALEGAANFMIDRNSQAQSLFNDAIIKDEDEIKLWQRATDIVAGKKHNFDFMTYNKDYIRLYPPLMQHKLAKLAVENALSLKKYALAKKSLNQMLDNELLEVSEDYIAYITGRIAAENGDIETAQKLFQPLIDNVEDNYLRSHAMFSLATNRYKKGEINREELISALKPVQLLWRGDSFELNTLSLLGELYANNNQSLEALRSWREIVDYYPKQEIALEIAGKMANSFIKFFNEGGADDISPLHALSLYYEFRDLTPIGKAGDKMVQQLAERLEAVDLLDKAAKLLEYQVTYRLSEENRSEIGAKLALIHLQNRKPEKALQVLELTGYGDNSEELQNKRNHLASISYSKLGQWQKAINLLRDDYSEDAKLIRSDIYWDIKDWYNLAMTLEDILGSREIATDALSEQEVQALLRLCVAYSFMGDSQQLAYLRDYFTPLLVNENDKNTFAFLTTAIDSVNRDNISRIAGEIGKMKDFLDNYQVSIKEEKLNNFLARVN